MGSSYLFNTRVTKIKEIMSKVIIQIDANNFYASCEKMIDPSLRGKGLVILSNNDGCIIARSSEARKMGIQMGQQYLKLKDKLKQLNISVRSSNYELYQNIGIPISIGIGETKVLSKISNHIAKKINKHSGIFDISIIENKDYYLNQINVDKVWGIGNKMSTWLKQIGITNARELRDMSSNKIKKKYGIVGLRIQNELKGKICIPIKEIPSDRKRICVSRSFSYPIDSLEELNQAISKYVLIASAKLRKYNQLASSITVFIATNIHSKNFFKSEATDKIHVATSDSRIILKKSLALTKKIFKPYNKFIKAGVILDKLQSNKYKQNYLFKSQDIQKELYQERLDKLIDNINKNNRRDTLVWGSSIIESDWNPRREKLSYLKTSSIESIPTVFAH